MDRWDLPVAVFPFNIVIVLYLLVTRPDNPYFPHYPSLPVGALQANATELNTAQVRKTSFMSGSESASSPREQ